MCKTNDAGLPRMKRNKYRFHGEHKQPYCFTSQVSCKPVSELLLLKLAGRTNVLWPSVSHIS